jgi:hypothetical protein
LSFIYFIMPKRKVPPVSSTTDDVLDNTGRLSTSKFASSVHLAPSNVQDLESVDYFPDKRGRVRHKSTFMATTLKPKVETKPAITWVGNACFDGDNLPVYHESNPPEDETPVDSNVVSFTSFLLHRSYFFG